MKPLIIISCLAMVFVLLVAGVASAGTASAGSMDTCKMCHPTAHPEGWVAQGHEQLTRRSPEEMQVCAGCHASTFCTDCHTRAGVGAAQP